MVKKHQELVIVINFDLITLVLSDCLLYKISGFFRSNNSCKKQIDAIFQLIKLLEQKSILSLYNYKLAIIMIRISKFQKKYLVPFFKHTILGSNSSVYLYSHITKQLDFTQNFKKALRQKLALKEKGYFLRLQILAGCMYLSISEGCEGFTYKFKFDNQLTDSDFVHQFQCQNNQKKVVFAANGQQMKLLNGATLDYAEQMMREIFYVKENPNAEISCSCKTSFSPKDYVF